MFLVTVDYVDPSPSRMICFPTPTNHQHKKPRPAQPSQNQAPNRACQPTETYTVRDMHTERRDPSAPAAPAPLHLVFVPFLARSHFAPLAAAAASSCGENGGATTASILTTPHFAALAPRSVPVHVAPFRSTVQEDEEEDFSRLPPAAHQAFFAAAEAALAPALAAAVVRASRGGAVAVAVVSDAVLYWAPRVARECGVPHVTFHTVGAFAAAAMVALHLHPPEASSAGGEPFALPGGFPRPHVRLRRTQVNEEALAHLHLFRAAEADSCAVVFNSFSALEADYAAYYRSQLAGRPKKQVLLVGPTRLAAAADASPPPRAVTTCGGVERDPILQWLDNRPARSVVYVCFGSTCALGASQLRELAAGLRASGHPFLWVIPTPPPPTEEQEEERASSHGMVVAGRWAPQAEILAHRAVGGFVTHCGWNSVMEAACAGLPLATWPLRAEQFLNEAFLVEVVRVGVRVRDEADDPEAVVPAEMVARAVGRLMGDEGAAEERRARASRLGDAARAAVADGGSSRGDWARLLDVLRAFYADTSDAPAE